jgi:hypothetical protein
MSYKSALEAAGATVLHFANFGDYSGTWYAQVEYKGETGWISDWYGSCSHCDAFQREFDYCHESYEERLAEFGKRYLDSILPAEHFFGSLKEDAEWSQDAETALFWIRHIEGIPNV